ncbi:hypothetical protein N798_08580 [Knoellia flava TL1]|uniref:Uncharacterized protein n=2 Tax=Knoellia flava TaxID=913969 RepID=A0A8H9FS42_9MICO|nr:hypothetical protein [Knoellia flava]KGN31575.1 hypothetical protein N798_08580 [Knoellia flava TL1]GGB68197.1 hypothetical protein GCM10011314_04300 [Knoellia flava]
MNPSPAFVEALREEREALRELLRRRPSAEVLGDALGRLADLDDLEARAVERPAAIS